MPSITASWARLENELERALFLLASFSPEGIPVPLWLLGLVTGQGDVEEACRHMLAVGVFESVTDQLVSLNSQQRQFGQHLVQTSGIESKILVAQAASRLLEACWTLDVLEQRALRVGYRVCREQVQTIRQYLDRLGSSAFTRLVEQLEDWLSLENALLTDSNGLSFYWPETLPDLFCQQLFNRSVEANCPLTMQREPARWLRLVRRVGTDAFQLLSPHLDRVGHVTFSPDGSLALTCSPWYGFPTRLWEVASGRELRHLQGLTATIKSAAFSGDGRLVLTCCDAYGEKAQLWEVASGRKLRELNTSPGWVTSVALSLDGRLALTCYFNKTISLWEVGSGRELRQWHGHTSMAKGMAFSPDGRLAIIAGSYLDRPTRLWEVESGRELRQLQGCTVQVKSVAFSPDGQLALTCSDAFGEPACLWEVESGRELRQLRGHTGQITSVAFSPDGRLALTGSWDRTARLWEVSSGQEIQRFGHLTTVTTVAFSPDGQWVLTACDNETIRRWNVEKGDGCSWENELPNKIKQIIFSQNGRLALTWSSSEKRVRLWEVESGREIWSSSEERVRPGEVEGERKARHLLSFEPWRIILHLVSPSNWFDGLKFALRDHLARRMNREGQIRGAAISPGGRFILVDSGRGAPLWDLSCGQRLRLLWGHAGHEITSVAFSTDGQLALTGSRNDKNVFFWDLSSGRRLRRLRHSSGVTYVAFSPDGRSILTCTYDSTISLWEMANGRLLQQLKSFSGVVTVGAFSPDGKRVLAGSEHRVQLWEVESGRVHLDLSFQDRLGSVAFSPDGRLLIVCNHVGRVYFYQGQEPEVGRLLGIYVAASEVGAIYWQRPDHLVIAEKGKFAWQPHFSSVTLEGGWE